MAKSSRITARSLTLNLNGTKFRGLWHGDTASALTRLTGDRGYGVNSTLQAFN